MLIGLAKALLCDPLKEEDGGKGRGLGVCFLPGKEEHLPSLGSKTLKVKSSRVLSHDIS